MKVMRILFGLCLLTFLTSGVAAGYANFTDVEPVSDSQPDSFSQKVQVEEPYHQNSTASRETNQQTKYQVQLSTSSDTKTIWIAIESSNIYKFHEGTDKLEVMVDGELVDWETRQAQDKLWIVLETDGDTITVSSTSSNILDAVNPVLSSPIVTFTFLIILAVATSLVIVRLNSNESVIYV